MTEDEIKPIDSPAEAVAPDDPLSNLSPFMKAVMQLTNISNLGFASLADIQGLERQAVATSGGRADGVDHHLADNPQGTHVDKARELGNLTPPSNVIAKAPSQGMDGPVV